LRLLQVAPLQWYYGVSSLREFLLPWVMPKSRDPLFIVAKRSCACAMLRFEIIPFPAYIRLDSPLDLFFELDHALLLQFSVDLIGHDYIP
jgi:hypothetical protein